MNAPLVSVNLTTYNRAHLLPRALHSLLAQSYQNLEIMVVDDCSSDNTREVVEGYQNKDSRVRYYRHEINFGNAHARNTALKHCGGEFVAFMDDDDEWIDSQKLEKQVAVLQGNPKVDIICTSVRRYTSPREYVDVRIEPPKNLKGKILRGNGLIYNSTVMTRRAVMVEVGGFDERMTKGVDSEFYRRCIVKHGSEVCFMPDITTAVYEHGEDRMTPVNTTNASKVLRNNIYLLYKYKQSYLRHPTAALKRMKRVVAVFIRTIRGI